ncbi:3-beta hydroxysteroid dehydrogenase [Nocardioides flavus (ex Wang et al. 2016)]|uniref:3-beta hydroxysteroid dehydrogenase n=1 Tax=Nocardioides flavus (ex Wang et al. 2016) TaxID=2058780 RepID=A0ABQ3HJD8_9ACTN|nr:SDR family oxidoreductase [Nocardioides flavus (ex Wang et al. 2016)]GHE16199.1 3-beta hydroxysteroid dehydrogenase [Nocardioides flavus (ex Wang et al. 2016)]
MGSLLMTGFPGFLGSALLPRLLARRPRAHAVCLVQDRHLTTARDRLAAIEAAEPHVADRVRLVVGDITEPGLGLAVEDQGVLADVTEIWHLAAVYDLAVGEEVAHLVNVVGTDRVLDLCRSLPDLQRLHHVSTCYVSGRHAGLFREDELEVGQEFRNHYESTKYDAELLVRKAMAAGIPATIYRPGIVVGDSRTGETQKYDGPYFLATFLRRQPPVAVVPRVADPDRVRFCLVPRDFVVDAMDRLSVLEESGGRTYALTDPDPPTARELVDAFARRLGKHVVWVPLPLPVTRAAVSLPLAERLLGLPVEALDYFASPTTYDTTHTTADLAATGLTCPRFEDYADRLLDYMLAHPEHDAAAMV